MTPFNEARKALFLDALRETANVTVAARSVGVSSGTAYKHKAADPLFAEQWAEALEEAVDLLEHEAHRRAFEGTKKPVFYKGGECGYVTEYSDGLAQFLLKAHRPDKYRERSEVKQEISGGMQLNDTTRAARLAALIQIAQQRAKAPTDDTSDLV